MSEVILIYNKNGELLDFSPRNIKMRKFSQNDFKEIYDDGELIRIKLNLNPNETG
ncbi:hypothetical protein [Metallosphaera tengchongensis]|uniref:hypothetical protein n=1 Tax=Metallosphaera tengchongensis TaxID=1532350 RepID=UPI00157D686C|nr:hypothetical protein [Metallosphaera tengchongensis]